MSDDFWERPEVVDRFASRDPDLRLTRLFDGWREPARVRALDLGCAGGRNTRWLAERGCRVWAVDASAAMVERTRARLADLLGPEAARRQVRQGAMDDLGWAADERFDLVVALGIYHNASSRAEWDRALAETVRVLAPGGRLLAASFTPGTDLTGEGMEPVPDEPGVFTGSPSGRLFLVTAEELEAEMARFGLRPVEATTTVRVATDPGRRVTANGLFEKPVAAGPGSRR